MMRLHGMAVTVRVIAALVLMSVSLFGQGESRPAAPRPGPPAKTADGQPNVEGTWRPVSGGTHSLDPALSSAQEFDQRITGVIKRNPSFVVDPPDGHIPYQPWAASLRKNLEANYENPTRPEHVDTQTRCLVPGIPRLYYFPSFRIIQTPGTVVFVWDEYHTYRVVPLDNRPHPAANVKRSEEHTSELQSLRQLVCRLLLEKKDPQPH